MLRICLFICLLGFPALAEDVPYQPGETLRVDVWGQPDLSGERQIDESGRIAFPFVGRITAAGITAEALETEITQRLAEAGYEQGAIVTVSTVRRLDVYVDGAVGAPGAHAWRPGLTIDQVLALAGGRILVTNDELGPALQALRAIEYAAGLESRLKSLRLVEARLQAETSFISRSFGPMPQTGVEPLCLLSIPEAVKGDPTLAALVQTEVQLLASRCRRSVESLAALETRISIQADRLTALERRETSLAEVEALIRDRLQAVKDLGERGLAAKGVVVEVTQAYASTVSEQLNVAAALAETRAGLAELQQSRDNFADQLLAGIEQEMRAVQIEIADVSTRQDPSARAAALARGYEGAGLVRASEPGSAQTSAEADLLVILRGSGTGQKSILASAGFVLLPGDTVVVPFASED